MANVYKQYMKLLKKWPIDELKPQDLGQHIRDRVKIAFAKGENSKLDDPRKCQEYYESLNRISSNHYRNKYPCSFKKTVSGLTPEQCKIALSPEAQEYLSKEKAGFLTKLKNTVTYYSSRK